MLQPTLRNTALRQKIQRLDVKFQEVVHAKESWEDWVDEDPKHPATSNA
jgi:hypothetical protein